MKKKLIGTATLMLVLGGLAFFIAGAANAEFVQTLITTRVEGVVGSVGTSSFTVNTPGGSGQTFNVTNTTMFRDGSFASLLPGMRVAVLGFSRSTPVARIVWVLPGVGYGTAGDPVIVRRGDIVLKGGAYFVVSTASGNIRFEVTASTVFSRRTFAQLIVGDTVTVTGEDTGAAFVARTVTWRPF